MHAEDAPVAFGVELEIENVEVAIHDGGKEPLIAQHPLDVGEFSVEVQGRSGEHVLRLIRGFIYTDDRSLNGIDIDDKASDDHGGGRESLADQQ
jgi:hypothetical protein